MGRETKIDWCDSTWNPVTGCQHECEYCYACSHARRFTGGGYGKEMGMFISKYKEDAFKPPYELDEPQLAKTKSGWYRQAPYPFGFEPTFHRYKLNQPKLWREQRTIFVCSMADLFGEWVPDEWIQQVFAACEAAPHHTYMFLTKNPERYKSLEISGQLPEKENFWYGSTACTNDMNKIFIPEFWGYEYNTFVSIEPIHSDFNEQGVTNNVNWVIVGAETGNRRGIVRPEREWIENLTQLCEFAGTPLFMKESLRTLMGDDFRQEFPWEV